jgi:hypothetical protein
VRHLQTFLRTLLIGLVAGCATPAPSGPTLQPTSGSLAPTGPPVSTPASTQIPVPSPESTDEPVEPGEPSVGFWAPDPPTPLLMRGAVRPVVSKLNVRRRPSVSARVLATVTSDQILLVSGTPPVKADGYVWYVGTVWSAGMPQLPEPLRIVEGAVSGWFAASKGDGPFVTRVKARCPSTVDLARLKAMLPAERLACFDDRSIELEGTFGCYGCSIELAGEFEPAWLAYPGPTELLWTKWEIGPGFAIRFPPDGPQLPAQGSVIRVRGHFDDSAAGTCALALPIPWNDAGWPYYQVPGAVARHLCRQEMVVEGYDVLGTDPDFPAG